MAAPSNFVEINAGGFQAVSDSSQYVRIRRVAQGTSNPNLMNVVGGYLSIGEYDDDEDVLRQQNYGLTRFQGQVQVGTSSWQYAGKRVGIELNTAIKIRGNQSGFTGTNTNTLAGGRNLGQSIQSGGNLVILNPNSSADHYTLPCEYQNTEYAEVEDFEYGDMIWIWNRDDDKSAYIKGIAHGGLNSNFELHGGKAMMCMFWEYFDGSWSSDTDKGWVVMSGTFDNTG